MTFKFISFSFSKSLAMWHVMVPLLIHRGWWSAFGYLSGCVFTLRVLPCAEVVPLVLSFVSCVAVFHLSGTCCLRCLTFLYSARRTKAMVSNRLLSSSTPTQDSKRQVANSSSIMFETYGLHMCFKHFAWKQYWYSQQQVLIMLIWKNNKQM